MTIRLHVPQALSTGLEFPLPDEAARHAQVRRVQPGDGLQLFDGRAGEWQAQVVSMGRREVVVRVGAAVPVTAELAVRVTLAVGIPANERMDTLVEKATELGVAVIQPLLCERSVLRLAGERAQRRQQHWQGIAVAACEQSGRASVPQIEAICTLPEWLASPSVRSAGDAEHWLLSPSAGVLPLSAAFVRPAAVVALSGPEGGLSPAEEQAAQAAGYRAVGLGPRILRADTAPLVVLVWAGLSA